MAYVALFLWLFVLIGLTSIPRPFGAIAFVAFLACSIFFVNYWPGIH
jgi:hypothetical protein